MLSKHVLLGILPDLILVSYAATILMDPTWTPNEVPPKSLIQIKTQFFGFCVLGFWYFKLWSNDRFIDWNSGSDF